eukprot:4686294-Pleurochrysis_carterae.AAC.1
MVSFDARFCSWKRSRAQVNTRVHAFELRKAIIVRRGRMCMRGMHVEDTHKHLARGSYSHLSVQRHPCKD